MKYGTNVVLLANLPDEKRLELEAFRFSDGESLQAYRLYSFDATSMARHEEENLKAAAAEPIQ